MKKFKVPTLRKLKRPKLPTISRDAYKLAVQVFGVLWVLRGVAAYSAPCALILGGLTLIIATELQE